MRAARLHGSLHFGWVLLLEPGVEEAAVPQANLGAALGLLLDVGDGLRATDHFNEANAVASGEAAIGKQPGGGGRRMHTQLQGT